jgi:hypothetical protein
MTARGTVALLAVLAALLGYVTMVDRPSVRPTDVAPLLTVPPAQATRVEIVWPEARLLGVRRDGEWRDERERGLPSGLVDDLLSALATVRPIETLTASAAAASEYGFGAKATTVAVAAAGNPLLALEVGDRTPSWTGVYVRRSGAPDVLVVGALLHWELAKLRGVAASR